MLIEEAEAAAASFFPTTNEVVRAVQFVRENPAVVLGVVVGITSLSVARYYEDDEQDEDETHAMLSVPDQDEAVSEPHEPPQAVELPSKLRRSSTASTLTPAVSGEGSFGASEEAMKGEARADAENKPCHKLHKNCSFCNQAKKTPDACCDPDWGWFMPTSAEDEHHDHEHHHASVH